MLQVSPPEYKPEPERASLTPNRQIDVQVVLVLSVTKNIECSRNMWEEGMRNYTTKVTTQDLVKIFRH